MMYSEAVIPDPSLDRVDPRDGPAPEILFRKDQASRRQDAESAPPVQRERLRLARELHDGLVQEISATLLMLREAAIEAGAPCSPAFDAAAASARRALQIARATIRELRAPLEAAPPPPSKTPLTTLVSRILRELPAGSGLATRKCFSADTDLDCATACEVEAILRETLVNVAKHAGASRLDCTTTAASNWIHLELRDNGAGFDPGHPHVGFGLLGMAERAALVGGHLGIVSSPSRGTRVTLRLPCSREREPRDAATIYVQ